MRFLIFLTGIFLATFAYANRPVLTVYAPDYFVSEWGPGPSIEEAFEKTCGCDLKFSAGGFGAPVDFRRVQYRS